MLSVERQQIYRLIFTLAGFYNIAFGLWAALFPRAIFRLLDLGEPSHPAIWACLGMVVGLYGLLYLQVAFTDQAHRRSALRIGSRRIDYDFTRALIALGLAGKILGPLGFVVAMQRGDFPPRLLSLLVFNDLVWWPAFALYLLDDSKVAVWIYRHAPRICSVAHLIAAVATALWISGGSEAVADPRDRVAFIAGHVARWRTGWILWMFAAATLVGFLCWWAARSRSALLASAALSVAFAGIAADYFADALFIGWMPEHYLELASIATFISEVVANGLYSIAGALLMLATPRMRARIRYWGWAVWLSGFALAGSRVLRSDHGIVASSALLLALVTPWVWIAGREIDRPA